MSARGRSLAVAEQANHAGFADTGRYFVPGCTFAAELAVRVSCIDSSGCE